MEGNADALVGPNNLIGFVSVSSESVISDQLITAAFITHVNHSSPPPPQLGLNRRVQAGGFAQNYAVAIE